MAPRVGVLKLIVKLVLLTDGAFCWAERNEHPKLATGLSKLEDLLVRFEGFVFERTGGKPPFTANDLNISVEWYAHPNDLIGGWSVMNVDKPPSQCDFRKGEGDVADFTTEALAKHIVELHNKWLREKWKLVLDRNGEPMILVYKEKD